MDHADRILTFALGFALLVIGLLVALLFVDATSMAKRRSPSGKVPIEVFRLAEHPKMEARTRVSANRGGLVTRYTQPTNYRYDKKNWRKDNRYFSGLRLPGQN